VAPAEWYIRERPGKHLPTAPAPQYGARGPNALVATDSAGNVYVADTFDHTIRKIDPTGVVSTLAGMAGVKGSTNGTGSAARFDQPSGVAADDAGNL